MGDYTVKKIEDMEAVFGGGFIKARSELGVTSFGMQVLEFPPNSGDAYPEHDHAEGGQEEVYVLLRGSATISVDGEERELTPDVIIRVGPGAKRHIRSGPDGARILALGGVPGRAYEIVQFTEVGEPDPTTASGAT